MKNNRVVLIVVGLLLLCCCVAAVGGAVAYSIVRRSPSPSVNISATPSGGYMPSLNGPVSGGLGNEKLKTDVWNDILKAESQKGCRDVTSTAIDVVQTPNSGGVWVEDWSLNACGKDVVLEITFTLDATGTSYDVKQK